MLLSRRAQHSDPAEQGEEGLKPKVGESLQIHLQGSGMKGQSPGEASGASDGVSQPGTSQEPSSAAGEPRLRTQVSGRRRSRGRGGARMAPHAAKGRGPATGAEVPRPPWAPGQLLFP